VGTDAMVINGTVVTHPALARAELFGGNVDGDVLSGRGGGAAGGVFRQVMLIVAGKGASTLLGGNGPDKIVGDSSGRGDLIVGGANGDSIQGSGGEDAIDGGPGGDVIAGSGGDDMIRGMTGADDLTGDGGADRLLGGPGDDTINAGDGVRDAVNGGRDGINGDTAYVDCGTDQVSKVEFVNCVSG
jgi:Ca2+-binding RTX toxin-like protein